MDGLRHCVCTKKLTPNSRLSAATVAYSTTRFLFIFLIMVGFDFEISRARQVIESREGKAHFDESHLLQLSVRD